jgi:hypothetical protein
MKPSINEVARRLHCIPLGKQIAFLRDIVALEKKNPRSHRFIELQLMLQDRMTRQIARQNRGRA